jgi:hypothetical protein
MAGLVVLAACQTVPYKAKAGDIRRIAAQIADYQVPEGYSEQYAVELAGYQLVSLVGPTPNCHLFLAQAPADADIDIDELQRQAREMNGDQKVELKNVRVVEQRPVAIRGQQVTLLVGEGVNSDEKLYREVTAVFTGKNGPALVSISSPFEEWDWASVDEFLASIQ